MPITGSPHHRLHQDKLWAGLAGSIVAPVGDQSPAPRDPPHMHPGPAVMVGDTGGGHQRGVRQHWPTSHPPLWLQAAPNPPSHRPQGKPTVPGTGTQQPPTTTPQPVTGATSGCGRSPPPCHNTPAQGTRACCPLAGAAGTHGPRRVPGSTEYSLS